MWSKYRYKFFFKTKWCRHLDGWGQRKKKKWSKYKYNIFFQFFLYDAAQVLSGYWVSKRVDGSMAGWPNTFILIEVIFPISSH